ncbi:sodium/mannose cotransporter SLC5A10-like [Porites lutea]|uniref:sodium/mannose cotransporter SLC5A10-like n=1 Tax=Porites lutea TaxID=51062 RepID=UPI003CC5B682
MVFVDQKQKSLEVLDWVIIGAYFLGCIFVGLWSKFKKQKGKDETAETYFLAGRSMLWWAVGPSLFASNMGSEHFVGLAGSGAATGIAVVAYEWQASWILLLLGWIFLPIYLRSRVFTMPEYLQKRFQSRWVRTYLTAVALISYVFTKTSVDIYAGSVFLYEAVGWNIYISAACILAITAVYTVLGGLTAVIFTDVLQCVIMIIGAVILAVMSFVKVGGYNGLWEHYGNSLGKSVRTAKKPLTTLMTNVSTTAATTMVTTDNTTPTLPTTTALLSTLAGNVSTAAATVATTVVNATANFTQIIPTNATTKSTTAQLTTLATDVSTSAATIATTLVNVTTSMTQIMSTNLAAESECFKLTEYWSNMFRPLDDPDYPWLGLWITLPIMGVWYWCTDQVIVQRALGAKNNTHAKAGSVLAGFLKILPIFVMVMPGMISRVLFPDSIACPDPESCKVHCGNEFGCTNNAYPKLVLNVLPTGLVGLMLAVMMAALMSSLSSVFNSSATIFTVDVWLRFRPQAKEREKVIVGRVIVAVLVGVSLCWLPIIQGSAGTQLFVYIQTIQSYLAPPITMVFGLGILWPGLTSAGALSGLVIGFILGMAKFIAGNVYPAPRCGAVDDRPGFAKMHFMYYAMIIFGVCGLIMAVVSLFTEKIPRDELGGLTWSTINEPPISHGALGEEDDAEKTENGHVKRDSIELLKNGGKDETFDSPEDTGEEEKHKLSRSAIKPDKIKLTVVKFAEEDPIVKWFLRFLSFLLLLALLFLWVYYR